INKARNNMVNLFVNELLARIKVGAITSPQEVIKFDADFRKTHAEPGNDFNPGQATYVALMRARALPQARASAEKRIPNGETSIEIAYKLLSAADVIRHAAQKR